MTAATFSQDASPSTWLTQWPAHASRAEAARYALLRRLAPAMQHHLTVNLQPIGMVYEVMDRRLKAPEPDLPGLHAGVHKINGFARAALRSCVDVVTWLSPDADATATVAEGVAECIGLLGSGLSFRGYTLHNQVGAPAGEVHRSAMRNLIAAMLVYATDTQSAPATLVLTAHGAISGVELTLSVQATPGAPGFAPEPGYRPLTWGDVDALAAAESVGLVRKDRGRICITLPWARRAQA